MARVIFWDVDTQYDFMKADGKLYVPDAEQLIPNLKKLTDYAHGHGIRIIASADDHVREHEEISATPDWKSTFPPHCLRGTPGQKKIPETALRDPLVIEPEPQDPQALASRIKSHRGDILLAVPGVVGTAVGRCRGAPCIRVLVTRTSDELRQRIPRELGGFPVQIDVTGPIVPR
jgi:hypothetical protein